MSERRRRLEQDGYLVLPKFASRSDCDRLREIKLGHALHHQDATFLYTEPVSVIGLWFALEDATCDIGCLELLPGAHREGLRSRYRRDGYRTWMETIDPRPWPDEGWVPIEAPAGTLVVFHGLLPHRSGPNRSAVSRCATTLHVIDGATEVPADIWLQRPADMPLRGFEA